MEEDRLLMESVLPNGMLLCYAGAPDAAMGGTESTPAPVQPGDEARYVAAGYELAETYDNKENGQVRIWRTKRVAAPSRDYVEVKMSTSCLAGAGGEYKK